MLPQIAETSSLIQYEISNTANQEELKGNSFGMPPRRCTLNDSRAQSSSDKRGLICVPMVP